MYTVILTMTIKHTKESSFPQHLIISNVIYPREVLRNDFLSTILFETRGRACKYSWTLILLREVMIIYISVRYTER